ncbi:MAG: guanylate kinase [Pyrinomonadaceae bacterium]|nr:guanylate kinase [Pyrinomonadaceae bacterium]MCX7639569.1 guanylate kinase [Pyrinomonadaceae bacterium]MDW8303962.1 guanylate kinase [Acidobacteriota bacterium]
MPGKLFIISSPSGGGKGTLIREILRTVPKVTCSVSFTTRPKRQNEENGKDYFFVNHEEFLNLIEKGEFLEYAEVHGHLYGTSRTQVEDKIQKGYDVILEIDIQGADSIKKIKPEAVSIFIMPPSFETLRNRLMTRATETEESLKTRLANAKKEVKAYERFDYIVINDELNEAVENLRAIFIAERQKRTYQAQKIQKILASFCP